jgi:hypothetical protein
VALLTTTIVLVGPVHLVAGHAVANLTAYHVCFLVAAASALLGTLASITIRDADAAQTMVDPRERKRAAAAALADAAPEAEPVSVGGR